MGNFLEVMQAKKADLQAIADRYGARNMRVFGSTSRGEDTSKSDLDLLVEFQDGRDLFDLIGLKQDVEALLHRKVDVLTPNSLHWSIKDKILREAKSIGNA